MTKTPQEKGRDFEKEWAWAAGLFEGEGWIYIDEKRRTLGLTSTDKDVLEKFFLIVGFGNITKKGTPKKEHHKQAWSWYCCNTPDAQEILQNFIPYLGERRKQKAEELLAIKLIYNIGVCSKGHTLTGKREANSKYKSCLICRRERYAKKRSG